MWRISHGETTRTKSDFYPPLRSSTANSGRKDTIASTMHRIWNIPELLELVFDFLAIHDAAAAASTVCRSFWLVALAHIWRDINTFSKLLKLLPQDKLSASYHGDVVVRPFPVVKEHQLTGPRLKASTPRRRLEEPDWERLLFTQNTSRVSQSLLTLRL